MRQHQQESHEKNVPLENEKKVPFFPWKWKTRDPFSLRRCCLFLLKYGLYIQLLWTVDTYLLKNIEHGIEHDIDKAYKVCIHYLSLDFTVELGPIVCWMFQHIGADITGEKIEAYHLLKKQRDRTIVKFSRRKDYEYVMRKNWIKKIKTIWSGST